MKKVAYVRVSSKEQKIDRQIEDIKKLGIEEKYIYVDKLSGKDFERIGYKYMKKGLEKGDLLVVKSLDRFGRNYKEIIKEWNSIVELGADIKVIDMELLDTTRYKDLLGNFISDLVLQILSFISHQERDAIKQRQKEGIELAQRRGVKFGRPKVEVDVENFESTYEQVRKGDITSIQAMKNLGLSKATYYRRLKELKLSI